MNTIGIDKENEDEYIEAAITKLDETSDGEKKEMYSEEQFKNLLTEIVGSSKIRLSESLQEQTSPNIFGYSWDGSSSATRLNILKVIIQLVEILESIEATTTEGIFRIPGEVTKIEDIANIFSRGPCRFSNSNRYCVHDIAGTLKLFFRQMPEPLFPSADYPSIVDFGKIEDKVERLEKVKNYIYQLSRMNYIVLGILVKFFLKIHENESITQMPATNLATCFVPTLIRSEEADPLTLLHHSEYLRNFFTDIIINSSTVFGNILEVEIASYMDELSNDVTTPKTPGTVLKQSRRRPRSFISIGKMDDSNDAINLKGIFRKKTKSTHDLQTSNKDSPESSVILSDKKTDDKKKNKALKGKKSILGSEQDDPPIKKTKSQPEKPLTDSLSSRTFLNIHSLSAESYPKRAKATRIVESQDELRKKKSSQEDISSDPNSVLEPQSPQSPHSPHTPQTPLSQRRQKANQEDISSDPNSLLEPQSPHTPLSPRRQKAKQDDTPQDIPNFVLEHEEHSPLSPRRDKRRTDNNNLSPKSPRRQKTVTDNNTTQESTENTSPRRQKIVTDNNNQSKKKKKKKRRRII
jgi:hypothetical protein